MAVTLVWFRQDLRLRDNPALAAAVARGGPVLPVFVLDDRGDADWPPGGASRWWLHHSLKALAESLKERGSRLIIAKGKSAAELERLVKETDADAVYWNRRYEPATIGRDTKIKRALKEGDIDARSFNAALLFEPTEVKNKSGKPFQVFTPFWRHCLTLEVGKPGRAPYGDLEAPRKWPKSLELDDLGLLPKPDWAEGLRETWEPGEESAAKRLKRFVDGAMKDYSRLRDLPSDDGTSGLSPHLHFGEAGPRQIWEAVRNSSKGSGVFPPNKGAQVFLQEIGWREFAYHLLFHFPKTPAEPLREEFGSFPWRKDTKALRAWQRGRTGYPIVDAGMRQLWSTGWMHNRVRMIVASFLVKHLRISWTEGAAWFWDTLVDADLASNTLGWQWAGGCGADAAPYFRIFNPMLQGAKFDPDGDYVRRWVPELEKVPAKHVHEPWEADPGILKEAGVRLGRDYPEPIVGHKKARAEALAAFKRLRKRPG